MSGKVKGYTEFFVRSDSIASEERRTYGAYQWASETDVNLVGSRAIQDASITNAKIGTAAIGTANIGTLSFNQIHGGTATLGGTLDGDGVLSISNSAGSEVVRGDKDGITVKTSLGTSIIDGNGLISVNNFLSGIVTSQSGTAIAGNINETDIGVSINVSVSRQSRVYVSWGAALQNSDAPSHYSSLSLNIGGTSYSGVGVLSAAGGTNLPISVSASGINTIPSGTTTYKLQIQSTHNGGTMQASACFINYLILGN